MTTGELLLALVRAEICGEEVPLDVRQQLTPDVLPKLYRLANRHTMTHCVGAALSKLGLPEDEKLRGEYKRHHLLAIYRTEQFDRALGAIYEVLSNGQIPFIPLKGAILRQYYREPWLRQSCDMDILVREQDLDRAVAALTNQLQYKAEKRKDYHDISLYGPGQLHLELHFNIQEGMENLDQLLRCVWDYAQPVRPFACECGLTPEFFLFHQLAHMAYHFTYGGCGIKPFADLYILDRTLDHDRELLRSYCARCGIEKLYDNAMHLARVWFGDAAHTELTRKMEAYLLKGGVYGDTENRVSVQQIKRGGRLAFLLNRIFMPCDALAHYYTILKKHKWLYPFMQVRRWCRILFCGGMKRGAAELRANHSVTDNQVSQIRGMLDELGL